MAELPYVVHAVACQQMESVRPVKATCLAAPLRPNQPSIPSRPGRSRELDRPNKNMTNLIMTTWLIELREPNRPNKDMTNHLCSVKGNSVISKD